MSYGESNSYQGGESNSYQGGESNSYQGKANTCACLQRNRGIKFVCL